MGKWKALGEGPADAWRVQEQAKAEQDRKALAIRLAAESIKADQARKGGKR